MNKRQRKKVAGDRFSKPADMRVRVWMARRRPGAPEFLVELTSRNCIQWERRYSGYTRTMWCQCHNPPVLIDSLKGGDLGPGVKPPTRRHGTQRRRK